MGGPLKDFGLTLYYLGSDDFKNEILPTGSNNVLKVYFIVVSFLPYWWRFWQCINKYHYTGLRVHQVNAGKYFSKLLPPLLAALRGPEYFGLYIVFLAIATLYCLVWDYYMDWGLFRSKEPDTYGLRK